MYARSLAHSYHLVQPFMSQSQKAQKTGLRYEKECQREGRANAPTSRPELRALRTSDQLSVSKAPYLGTETLFDAVPMHL